MVMNVMIDIETFAVESLDPYIVGIGAVGFDPAVGYISTGEYSFRWVSPVGNDDQGEAALEPETVRWWITRAGSAAGRRLLEHGDSPPCDLRTALWRLDTWIDETVRGLPARVWASGPQFDLTVLRRAAHRLDAPWRIDRRSWRDFRTLREEAGERLGVRKPLFTGVEHDPLDDAFHAAGWALEILAALTP